MIDAPDFPSLEPIPSMAAFPFSLDSLLSGIKAISLVTSKKVNFDALEKIFWKEPKAEAMTNGEVPSAPAKATAEALALPK